MHSDLNAKNLLVDPDTLEVTGVLDWELAHSGLPWTDLGNLLRFDRHPVFVEAVLAAYTALMPTVPERPPRPRAGGGPVRAGGAGRPGAKRTKSSYGRGNTCGPSPAPGTCMLSRSAAAQ